MHEKHRACQHVQEKGKKKKKKKKNQTSNSLITKEKRIKK